MSTDQLYVDRCASHMAETQVDLANLHQLGWCRECHQQVYLHVLHEDIGC